MTSFLAVGQDRDIWRVEAASQVIVGYITDARTDNQDRPIMIRVTDDQGAGMWVPWDRVTLLVNQSENARSRKRAGQ